jgi:putative aldouronate transport system substrate-binding protein
MKKTVFGRLLSIVLIAVMTAALFAGCKKDEPGKTDNSGSGSQSSTSTDNGGNDVAPVQVSEDAGIKGWKKFDNNVTISIPVYDRGEDGDETNNYWTQWIQKEFGDKYNITVNFQAIGRGTVLDDYNNLATANNLPTVLMEYDFDKCAYWANDGFLQELDLEAFANVAPTYYKMMVDNNYLQYTSLNGKTYFVLAERPYSDTNYTWVTFYRQDWLDALGKTYPVNWADWLDLYKAIKDKGYTAYPAGGTKVEGAGVDQNYAYRAYPQDEVTWATQGDYSIPALTTDAQKTLLQRRNQLYNLGYYDPDFTTKSSSDAEADFVAGKAFSYSTYISPSIGVLDSFYAANPDAKLAIAPVSTASTDGAGGVPAAYRVNNAYGMMIGFSAKASADQVKAAQMYMEWLIQPENLFTFQYGYENDTFKYDANGNANVLSAEEQKPEYLMVARQNKDYFCIVIEARKLASIEDTVSASYPSAYKDSADFYKQILDNYKNYKKIISDTPMYAVTDCKFAATLEQAASLSEYLCSQYATYASQLTICKESEFDALYKSLCDKYLNDGYQTVIDERKALFDAGKTSSLPKY